MWLPFFNDNDEFPPSARTILGAPRVFHASAGGDERERREALIRAVRRAPCLVTGLDAWEDVAIALNEGAVFVVVSGAMMSTKPEELPPSRLAMEMREIFAPALLAYDAKPEGWPEGSGDIGAFYLPEVELDWDRGLDSADVFRRPVIVRNPGWGAARVAELDGHGIDVTGREEPDSCELLVAMLRTSAPPPWPTIVRNEAGGVIALAQSDEQTIGRTFTDRRAVWRSPDGNAVVCNQTLISAVPGADRRFLILTVRGPATGATGWRVHGESVPALAERLRERLTKAPQGSYTRRLLEDPAMLRSKLLEEAGELAEAEGLANVVGETADVLYFALVALARGGGDWSAVEYELERRSRRLTRRPGNVKNGTGRS